MVQYQGIHGRLIALKIFSVSKISALRVALHFPSSYGPLYSFDGLPTFLSKFLYSTKSLLFSAFRIFSSCSFLVKSDSSLPFSRSNTFLIFPTSLSLIASSSTFTCSLIWIVYRLADVWSCRTSTLDILSFFTSPSSYLHHSAKKLFRLLSRVLAYLWLFSSSLRSSHFSLSWAIPSDISASS